MSKSRTRKGSGRCVLCVKNVNNLTREHLFPKSWYLPEYTHAGTIRQTFPSCVKCNSTHGKSEERLLRHFGLSLDPESGVGAGIARKVIHSLSMTEAPNEKEASIRGKIKFQLLQNSIFVEEGANPQDLRLVPGLSVDEKLLSKGGNRFTTLDGSDIRCLIEKLVRGILYLEFQLFVEEERQIQWIQEKPKFVHFAYRRHLILPGLHVHFGPLPTTDYPAMLFIIEIWNQLTFYAACTPGNDPLWAPTVLEEREVAPLWDIPSTNTPTK